MSAVRTLSVLSVSLRVVGLLKRLDDGRDDAALRAAFLAARDVWLRSVLRSLPRDTAYGALPTPIGARDADRRRRRRLFVAAHRRDAAATDRDRDAVSRRVQRRNDARRSGGDGERRRAVWQRRRPPARLARASHRHLSRCAAASLSLVSTLIAFVGAATLESELPRVADGASLANLLDQAMYAGLTLGRVGADLRPLLVVPFERRALGRGRALSFV